MLQAPVVGLGQVMLFGDSNTEALWPNVAGECKILNAGFGAAGISDVISYVDPLAEAARPAIVHIMLGTNNLRPGSNSTGWWRNRWDSMESDLGKVVDGFKNEGAAVVLWAIPPTSSAFGSAGDRASINSIIRKVAADRGVSFEEHWADEFTGLDGYAVASAVVNDGVHLKPAVQDRRLDIIRKWDETLASEKGVSCSGNKGWMPW
ncbi:SGNH/GDSL hydrolase family protein [Rhizobium sp. YAF28]|uniref:SGNH/GDSL hydrolase family protein n=1 Tax=Rhizobium sp. YAF28 TaxID=3233081 RepID=UPI003F9D1C22